MSIDSSLVSRILVIKLRAIGDVLLSTVVLPPLRAAFPGTPIDFLTEKPSREVLDGNSDLSSLVVFDPAAQSALELVAEVRSRKYDLVIDLFGNPRSAVIALLSGARYRVGYRFKWRQYCYNIVVEPRGGRVHNTEFNLDALRAIGLPVGSPRPRFPLSDDGESFAERFFDQAGLSGKNVVALNPGGGWYTKRWPLDKLARLGDMIAERIGASILIVWGPREETDAVKIRSAMRSPAVVAPPTTLKQLASCLKRCSFMVTNDSGPMHIAAAVGTPVVAIFGPTNPELQGPSGANVIIRNDELLCLACNYTKCPIGNPCMEELSPELVMAGVVRLIETGPAPVAGNVSVPARSSPSAEKG